MRLRRSFLVSVFVFIFFPSLAFAGSTITRGDPATIYWAVSDAPNCTASVVYDGPGAEVATWNGQVLGATGNITFAKISAAPPFPRTYTFRCDFAGPPAAASDWDTLIVNDCSGATPNWDGNACVAAPPPPPASAPTGFTVTPSACGNAWLNLGWNAVAGATGYSVSRDGGAYIDVGNVTAWSDNPLAPGSAHNYTVRAYNGAGNGPATGSVGNTVSSACGFTITATAGPNGSVSPSGAVSVAPNGFQSFTYTPALGYVMNTLIVDGVSQIPVYGYTFVNVTTDHTIFADFVPESPNYLMTIQKLGTGSGTVTSNPAGINCGADCTESYPSNTTVSFTATPAFGSAFAGWGGPYCSGTGACSVGMHMNKTVTARFNALVGPLFVIANDPADIIVPQTAFTIPYSHNGPAGNTECRVLGDTLTTIVAYTPCNPSGNFPVPAGILPAGVPGQWGFYIVARNMLTSEEAWSNRVILDVLPVGATQCNNSNDDDGDLLIDMTDPGCVDPTDNNETNNAPPPAPLVTSNPVSGNVASGQAFTVTETPQGSNISQCEETRTSVAYGNDGPNYLAGSGVWTINGAGFVGPGSATYTFRCQDIYGQWSPTASVTITVANPVPILAVSPVPGAFGSIPVGSVRVITFSITNPTGDPSSVLTGNISFSDPHFTCPAINPTCSYSVPLGAPAATIDITYRPTAVGSDVATMTFTDNAPSTGNVGPRQHIWSVNGQGSAPVISVPIAVNFGTVPVTRYKELSFIVENVSATGLGTATFGGYSGVYTCISVATCAANGIDLAPGVQNVVTLRFTPTGAGPVPLQVGTLSGQPGYIININGTGATPVFDVREQ